MPERPTPTVRSSGGLAGARLPLAVAGFAALSSLVALIMGSISNAGGHTRAVEEELGGHRIAGEQAVNALEDATGELERSFGALLSERKKAAKARATELATFGALRASETKRKTGIARLSLPRSWKLGEREKLGLVDLEHDRIVDFAGADLASGSTLSAALPALSTLLKKHAKKRISARAIEDPDGVWAIGPSIAGGIHPVARVDYDLSLPEAEALARAQRLIGSIAAPETSSDAEGGPLLPLFFGALAAAVGAALWAHFRVTGPIARSLEVSRDFAHGRTDVRADPNRGGRDAREIALAINALIDRADRAIERGRAERGDDLSNAVLAIERLGKGDLREGIVPPGPVAQAIDRARRDLLERVTEMHHAAHEVAKRTAELAPAARTISEGTTEQYSTLRRLASSSDEAVEEIRKKAAELEVAINSLSATAQEHRHAIQELRASLSGLSRRVMALRGTAEEARSLASRAETIDQALSMLSRLAGQSDSTQTKARATSLVGDARAAMSEIGGKLEALEQEMLRAAHGLEILAQAQPEPPKLFEASVTQPFYDATSILVRTVELTVGCLTALERSTKTMAASGEALHHAAREAIDLVPRLGAALSAIRLGTSFEEQLLERLARMKAEVEAAKRTDGLTPDGERMLAEVIQASESARNKLIRLAQTTEAAIRAMRG